jgi:VWFA-related protein
MNQAISFILALLVAPVNPGFQQSPQPAPAADQSLRLRTDLVLVDVLPVQRKTSRVVANLQKDDFSVYEDGVKQTISYFSRESLPVSVILLVDRAGCVNPFNEQIRAATARAINQLKPEDEVAIMTFSNKVKLFQPFTRDRKRITDKIGTVEEQHESEQHYFNQAIYEASEYMKKAANPAGRRAIIALTSLEAAIDFSKISEQQALHAVLESGATVSGILVHTLGARFDQIIRGKPTAFLRIFKLRSGSLKMFVEETGGELSGAAPDKIDATINRVVENVAASYSLAYTSTNTARDGKRRKLRIDIAPDVVKREGRVAVLARRSYIAAKEPSTAK